MNIEEIHEIQSDNSYPCVSILLETHRTFPDNKTDSIRLKNLVNDAKERLKNEFRESEVSGIIDGIDEIVSDIDYNYLLNGMAIFVSKNTRKRIDLPFKVDDRVVINKTFATKDLVYIYNRSPRYIALLLSEQPTRLFKGYRDSLVEVENSRFPKTYEGPGVTEELPDGKGINKSGYLDDMMRSFFRQVDKSLTDVLKAEKLTIALLGVERNVSYFKHVSENFDKVIAVKHGSYDKLSAHEISKLIWPEVERSLAVKRRDLLAMLENSKKDNKFAAGLNELWKLGLEGRIQTIFVDKDYDPAAVLDDNGLKVLDNGEKDVPGVMDDVVDELVETVINKSGDVVFFEKDDLSKYDRVAAILRF